MESTTTGQKRDIADDWTPLQRIRTRATAGADERTSRIEQLKASLKEAEAQRKSLLAIDEAIAAVEGAIHDRLWCRALRLATSKRLIESVEPFDPQAASSLGELQPLVARHADEAIENLVTDFVEALGDETPDPDSRYPRFNFRRSFLSIEIQPKKRTAKAWTRVGKPVVLDADAPTLASHVRAEIARCFGREVDLTEFASRVRTSWQATERGARGEPAPIREVAAGTGDNVELDEFSVDLANTMATDVAAGLRLDHTKDTEKGLLLPGFEDRGYFGTLYFEQVI
jgi:hypothetical protein